MTRLTVLARYLAALSTAAAVNTVKLRGAGAGSASVAPKKACFRHVPAALLDLDFNKTSPGAGIDAKADFQAGNMNSVLKDGFLPMDCIKDYMYEHGDKYGDNRHKYKLEKVNNVAIVLYNEVVASEDRKPMTQRVCFEFCRRIPQMNFFGIVNGRDCYCTPYVTKMASDSSDCDAHCDGDKTSFCGGKTKSSVFSMHHCDNAVEVLKAAITNAGKQLQDLNDGVIKQFEARAGDISNGMQALATQYQQVLGAVGDSAASDLMQEAKVVAGKLQDSKNEVEKVATQLDEFKQKASSLDQSILDTGDAEAVAKAEAAVQAIEKTTAELKVKAKAMQEMLHSVDPTDQGETGTSPPQQYYSAVYFGVDRDAVDMTATCGGDLVGKPKVALEEAICARACDNENNCVGYSYFNKNGEAGLCFLFSKLKTLTYYTTCNSQQSVAKLKLKDFVDTSIKPDPSGKCKRCLKTVTKAERCYDAVGAP